MSSSTAITPYTGASDGALVATADHIHSRQYSNNTLNGDATAAETAVVIPAADDMRGQAETEEQEHMQSEVRMQ